MSGPTRGGVVLDTSAVIAYLLAERGAQRVEQVIAGSLISSVKLCEVVSKFAERGEVAADICRCADHRAGSR